MGRAVKRELLLVLAAAVTVLIMAVIGIRAPGIETAYAGDAFDIDDITQGKNSDGTVDPGATLSISLDDLDAKVYGLKEHYNNGELEISWVKGDFGASEDAETEFDGNLFSTTLRLADAGKYVWLRIGCKEPFWDTSYNLNSGQIPVDAGGLINVTGAYFNDATLTRVSPIVHSYEIDVFDPYLSYTCYNSGKSYTSYDDIYVKLIRNNETDVVEDKKLTSASVEFNNVSMSIGKKDTFKAILYFYYGSTPYTGDTLQFEDGADTPSKNTVFATKISANKAVVRWTGASGATGYEVYMGNKKVKTVKSNVYRVTISRKGAGKAKFRVIPIVKSGSKKIKGKSTTMKAKANVLTRNVSKYYKIYAYGKGQLVLKKISGSGKNYTLTCYAINNRIFKLKKYKKIKITVYADGKKIISKTIKNKTVNVKASASRKITLKVKGKEGDLKHGTVSYSISYDPLWEHGYGPF